MAASSTSPSSSKTWSTAVDTFDPLSTYVADDGCTRTTIRSASRPACSSRTSGTRRPMAELRNGDSTRQSSPAAACSSSLATRPRPSTKTSRWTARSSAISTLPGATNQYTLPSGPGGHHRPGPFAQGRHVGRNSRPIEKALFSTQANYTTEHYAVKTKELVQTFLKNHLHSCSKHDQDTRNTRLRADAARVFHRHHHRGTPQPGQLPRPHEQSYITITTSSQPKSENTSETFTNVRCKIHIASSASRRCTTYYSQDPTPPADPVDPRNRKYMNDLIEDINTITTGHPCWDTEPARKAIRQVARSFACAHPAIAPYLCGDPNIGPPQFSLTSIQPEILDLDPYSAKANRDNHPLVQVLVIPLRRTRTPPFRQDDARPSSPPQHRGTHRAFWTCVHFQQEWEDFISQRRALLELQQCTAVDQQGVSHEWRLVR